MLAINDFIYDLPDERIAKYPLPERDAAKLLVWRDGHIDHQVFNQLPDLLTGHEILFFNNTKVIPARLYFRKPSGGLIEVFLLEPLEPHLVELAMRATQSVVYQCTIGNLKRWAESTTLTRTIDLDNGQQCNLNVTLLDKAAMKVRFEWDMPQLPFARIVEMAGVVPIPPYLNRDSEALDQQRYQTVYSKKEGAVAAPTAGLHFTPTVLETLQQKGIQLEELTLHVSAGTFRPVKSANALEHDMHSEQVVVRRSTIEALLQPDRPVVAIGTTSMRTLESLYWFGVALLANPDAAFVIEQSTAFDAPAKLPSKQESLQAVMDCLERRQLTELFGSTQIYITPGYTFRICEGLITNFHQPGSTLMLLVAAFTGGQDWRDIYNTAMAEGYRFLSYGDSSLLWKGK